LFEAAVPGVIEDLFRHEFGHLVAALTRLLGPSNLPLAEDVVQEALMTAMQAWRFETPRAPKAWILQVAKNRAIDAIRRDKRMAPLPQALESEWTIDGAVESALAESEDAANQLAMMLAICDERLSEETHVTLILRLLCGMSPTEIARAFLVDTQTIERRLHRGRTRLQKLGTLANASEVSNLEARHSSVMQALYLLFNEGYHGSDADNPLLPAMCADAIRLAELLLESSTVRRTEVHALAALFCFHAARLETRLDADGVFVPLAAQDRSVWDRSLIDRGIVHISKASTGTQLTRWHLEAGIACEHVIAPSVAQTNWQRIVELYDALLRLTPSPIVALNRAVALAELRGPEVGRDVLRALIHDAKVSKYPFFWGALADLEERAGQTTEARRLYKRAIGLTRSRAERVSYERKLEHLAG
jgi:RNA polymerase sigma factor (sigma-70 family)